MAQAQSILGPLYIKELLASQKEWAALKLQPSAVSHCLHLLWHTCTFILLFKIPPFGSASQKKNPESHRSLCNSRFSVSNQVHCARLIIEGGFHVMDVLLPRSFPHIQRKELVSVAKSIWGGEGGERTWARQAEALCVAKTVVSKAEREWAQCHNSETGSWPKMLIQRFNKSMPLEKYNASPHWVDVRGLRKCILKYFTLRGNNVLIYNSSPYTLGLSICVSYLTS